MALFSRVHTWVSNEVLTASDLNAEFNNLLTYSDAAHYVGYSANTSQMQTTADPGGVGTESLAASIADELTRLRFAIKRMAGGAQWYVAPARNLTTTIATADITDGAVTGAKLAAAVAGDGLGIDGSSNLKVNVDGSSIETNADTLRVKALGITQAMRAAATYDVGTGFSTTYALASISADITSKALTGNGRPVVVGLEPDLSGNVFKLTADTSTDARLYLYVDGSAYQVHQLGVNSAPVHVLVSAAVATAGSHTYSWRLYSGDTNTITINNARIVVYEL